MALQTKYSKRLCPICKMDDKIVDSKISSPYPSEKLTFRANKESWAGLFYKHRSYFSYYKCNNCKLIYAPEHYSSQQLNNLYKGIAPNMESVPKRLLKKTQFGYFRLLKKWVGPKGDYLEVGPDIGMFTEYCVLEDTLIITGCLTQITLLDLNLPRYLVIKNIRFSHQLIKLIKLIIKFFLLQY